MYRLGTVQASRQCIMVWPRICMTPCDEDASRRLLHLLPMITFWFRHSDYSSSLKLSHIFVSFAYLSITKKLTWRLRFTILTFFFSPTHKCICMYMNMLKSTSQEIYWCYVITLCSVTLHLLLRQLPTLHFPNCLALIHIFPVASVFISLICLWYILYFLSSLELQ